MSRTLRTSQPWARVGAAITLATLALGIAACSATPELPTTRPADLTFDVGLTPNFATDMQSCLTEKGWDVSLGTDGSFITNNIPDGQHEAYESDQDACSKKFGYDAPLPTFSDDQLRKIFQHGLWDWKCLDEHDYSPDAPPSEQAFIDGYHTTSTLWSPFSQFTGSLPPDDLGKLLDACPESY